MILKNKVSVLMTVYNTSYFLNQSIRSVLNQSYKNFELIIVDDGSTDNSRKIIQKFKSKKIKKIFLKKNIGRVAALNLALKKSTGEFIAILDSDDFSNKNRLITQINFLNKDKMLMLVGSQIDVIDENNKKIYTRPSNCEIKKFNHIIHYKNIIPFSSVVFKRQIVKKNNFFSTKFKYSFDYDFVLRVKKKYKIYLIPKVLVKITSRISNLSNSKKLLKLRFIDLINNLRYSKKNFVLPIKIKLIINFYIISKFCELLLKLLRYKFFNR